MQGTHHGREEQLLQQSKQGTDEGLKACQRPKMVGREPIQRDTRSQRQEPQWPSLLLLPPQISLGGSQAERPLTSSGSALSLWLLQSQQAGFRHPLSVWSL